MTYPRFKISINRLGCCFCEWFSIEVFACHLRNKSRIPRHMLALERISRSSYPCLSPFGLVSEFESFTKKGYGWWWDNATYLSCTGWCFLS
jgi:hypothetical protein